MKHGPIALIDGELPVVALAPKDALYDKVASNLREVKAREGRLIALVSPGDEDVATFADEVLEVPLVHPALQPVVSVVPLQLLAYHVARRRGCDVDQPRNLAKSVTVEWIAGESSPPASRGAVGYPPRPLLNARDHDLLEGLNPEQAAAVSAGPGPLLVLAGAGSGKTRVLTRRMAWLMAHGTPEEALVALTFTNKAAGEMKERVAHLLGSRRPRSFVGTFHSFGVRLLRRFAPEAGLTSGFVVFDADDQLAVFRQALKAAGITDKTLTPKAVASKISRARNAGWSRDEYPRRFGDFVGTRLAELHAAYEKELKKANAVDFDDLLVQVGEAPLRERRRPRPPPEERHAAPRRRVPGHERRAGRDREASWPGEARNVFAVGDEDQSIYRWRGADVSNILEFDAGLPGGEDDPPRAELPLDRADPRGGGGRRRREPPPPRQDAEGDEAGRRAGHPPRPPGGAGRGARGRRADLAPPVDQARGRGRRPLPDERAVAPLRGRAREGAPPLPPRRRDPLLRAGRGEGRPRLPAAPRRTPTTTSPSGAS